MRPGVTTGECAAGPCVGVADGATLLSGCSLASASLVRYRVLNQQPFAGLFSSQAWCHPAGIANALVAGHQCPESTFAPGVHLEVAAKTGQATAADLRYQLSFGQTARECLVQGGVMTIIGVRTRHPWTMGSAGQVDVPLRYAVVREGAQPNDATKFKRLGDRGPDQTHVQFVDVEEG